MAGAEAEVRAPRSSSALVKTCEPTLIRYEAAGSSKMLMLVSPGSATGRPVNLSMLKTVWLMSTARARSKVAEKVTAVPTWMSAGPTGPEVAAWTALTVPP